MKLELQMTDEMREFLVYRGLHVLCTVNKKMELTATHFALCLVGGPSPMWGVWTVSNSKFQRFFGFRSEIEDQYPNRVWRRVMAQWSMHGIVNYPPAKRRQLMQEYLEGSK